MKDREISIDVHDYANQSLHFKSFISFYDFCVREQKFWEEQKLRIPQSINGTYKYMNVAGDFQQIIQSLDSLKDNVSEIDEAQLNQRMQQIRQNYFNNLSNHWLWSGHPYIEPFILCSIEHGVDAANSFIEYVAKGNLQCIQNINNFKGCLLGYEFTFQDSDITKRRNGEEISLGHLRVQFSESKNQLFSEVSTLKNDFENWDSDNRTQCSRIYKMHKYLGERKIRNQSQKFDLQLSDWKKNIADLEQTYEEKLKLKKPAEYWSKAARRYGIQGGLWTLVIFVLAVGGLVYLRDFFITWLQGKDIAIQLNSLQGLIFFGSIGTVYAFLLRVFSRLAFSSFHLMRDAEEREQLTYLYLSLTNESEMDKQSRDIVLQALFSRSETGLLAQEHGPTMPGIGDILKTASR